MTPPFIDELIDNLPKQKLAGFYLYTVRGAYVQNKSGSRVFQYMICDDDKNLLAKLTKNTTYHEEYYPDWFKILHIRAIYNYGYDVSRIQNYYEFRNIYDEKDPIVNKTVVQNLKLPTKDEYDHATCEGGTNLEDITQTLMIVMDALSYRKPNVRTAILENETFTNSVIYEQIINTLINDRRKTVRGAAINHYCRHRS